MLTVELLTQWFHEPLGPWPEERIFVPSNTWPIQDLTLLQDAKHTGLDKTEFLVSAPKDASPAAVKGRGVVTIDAHDRKKLTADGLARLNQAVKARVDEEMAELEGRNLSKSKLRPPTRADDLFKLDIPLRIWIKFEKCNAAIYLPGLKDKSTKRAPARNSQGVIRIHAIVYHGHLKPTYSTFLVKSLEVQTHDLSRVWFARYQFLAKLEALHPFALVRERMHPEEYIDLYQQRAHLDRGEEEKEEREDEAVVPKRRRRPHRAEIRSHFVAHAEWILAQQMSRKGESQRVIDVVAWYDWFVDMKSKRRESWEERRTALGLGTWCHVRRCWDTDKQGNEKTGWACGCYALWGG